MKKEDGTPNKYKSLKIHGKRIDEHRLIAIQYWGEDAVRGKDVHHKNGIKSDNRIENLELIDRSEHTRNHFKGKKQSPKTVYAKIKTARSYWNTHTKASAKPVLMSTLDGIPILCFESATATNDYGFEPYCVMKCCNGILKTYRNFLWRRLNVDETYHVPYLKRLPKSFDSRRASKIAGLK